MIETNDTAVYKLNFSAGKQGDLEGLFTAKKSHVKWLIDSKIEVYFGEVLGKHSEVYGNIEEKEIIFISDNPEVIKVIADFELENGHNPFYYTPLNFEHELLDPDNEYIIKEIAQLLVKD